MSLVGRVCLVTGASRGIGKGVAKALTSQGAKTYITGRNEDALTKTSLELGQNAIPVVCDHADDVAIKALFDRISLENDNQLDFLVNNCFAAGKILLKQEGETDCTKFWENEPELWDQVNGPGLRANYIASVYAARLMVPQKKGVIVNISSAGGLTYVMNAAYGVGKAAQDRMAQDMNMELKGGGTGVTALAVWPGAVITELVSEHIIGQDIGGDRDLQTLKTLTETGQSTEWVGKTVAALVDDPNITKKAGRVNWVFDIANEFDIREIDGSKVPSHRCCRSILQMLGATDLQDYPIVLKAAKFFPTWIKVPKILYDPVLWFKGNKF